MTSSAQNLILSIVIAGVLFGLIVYFSQEPIVKDTLYIMFSPDSDTTTAFNEGAKQDRADTLADEQFQANPTCSGAIAYAQRHCRKAWLESECNAGYSSFISGYCKGATK